MYIYIYIHIVTDLCLSLPLAARKSLPTRTVYKESATLAKRLAASRDCKHP